MCTLLHCALASGAVYCYRSCLWRRVFVGVFVAGGRCPNLTTASISLSAFFILCSFFDCPLPMVFSVHY